jgi:hypothetical protein
MFATNLVNLDRKNKQNDRLRTQSFYKDKINLVKDIEIDLKLYKQG